MSSDDRELVETVLEQQQALAVRIIACVVACDRVEEALIRLIRDVERMSQRLSLVDSKIPLKAGPFKARFPINAEKESPP